MGKRSLYSLYLICTVVLALLAGCTDKSDEKKSEIQASDAAVVSTAGSDESGKSVELKVAHLWGGTDPKAPVFKSVWERFQRDNPGIKITVEEIATEAYQDKAAMWLSSGALPDIFLINSDYRFLKFVEANSVLDLKPFLDEDVAWKDSFIPGTLDSITYNGSILGVPNEFYVMPFFYNKQILARYKLSPPETWEDFIADLEIIKSKKEFIPFMVTNDEGYLGKSLAEVMVTAAGGRDEWNDAIQGKGSFNRPEIMEGIQKAVELCDYGPEGINSLTYQTGLTAFATGKAAFYLHGTWVIGQLDTAGGGSKVSDMYDVMPVPYFNESMKDYVYTNVAMHWSVSSKIDRQRIQGVVKLLKEITSQQTSRDYIEMSKGFSCLKTAYYDIRKVGKLINAARLTEKSPYVKTLAPFENNDTASDFVNGMKEVIDKKMTPQQYVEMLDSKSQKY